MRILASLDAEDGLSGEVLAAIAREHELIVSHSSGSFDRLRLSLRNLLPERDVVSVLTHVVLGAEDGAVADGGAAEPRAIAELRSLRALVDAGSVVLCEIAGQPLTVDSGGEMRAVEAAVDGDLAAALLARRLDVDLFLLLGGTADGNSRELAAERFAAATGRRAAIGSPAQVTELAHV